METESHSSNHDYGAVRLRSEEGQALLEFAFVLPLLFVLLVGVIFVSRAFNLQMVLYGAAYEGTRLWASDPSGGDNNHCTPPACNIAVPRSINFERYVIPAVKQYISNAGFSGDQVRFFSRNPNGSSTYTNGLALASNNTQFIRLTLFYPIRFPLGSFAKNFQLVYVSAACTMKRGG